MKNQLFNFRRFTMLCHKEWLENWRGKLLLRALAPILGFVIIMLWSYFSGVKGAARMPDPNYGWRADSSLVWMSVCLLVGYAIGMTSQFMARVTNRKKRISWLLCPASVFEKFLVSLLSILLPLLILFPVALLVEELLRVSISSVIFPDFPVQFIWLLQWVGTQPAGLLAGTLTQLLFGIWIVLAIFSFFLLGATIWPKHSVLYTLLAGVGLFVVGSAVLNAWVWMIFPESWHSFDMYASETGAQAYWYYYHQRWEIVRYLIPLSIPLFIVLAYYRFKELEIINRW